MNPTYCVITKVPDPKTGYSGNMALELGVYVEVAPASEASGYLPVVKPLADLLKQWGLEGLILNLRAPVFHVGEILILDSPGGREIGYPGRKPGKWDVEDDEFDNIEDAIKRARELLDADLTPAASET